MKDSCILICVFVSKIEIRCLWHSITSDKKWKKIVIFLFSYLSKFNVLAYKISPQKLQGRIKKIFWKSSGV